MGAPQWFWFLQRWPGSRTCVGSVLCMYLCVCVCWEGDNIIIILTSDCDFLSLSLSDTWWLSGAGGCLLTPDTGTCSWLGTPFPLCLFEVQLSRMHLFLQQLLLYRLLTCVSPMSPRKCKHANPYSSVCSTSLSIVLETQLVMFMLCSSFVSLQIQHLQISHHCTLSTSSCSAVFKYIV